MTTSNQNPAGAPADSAAAFVLFPLGSRRFALPASAVTELARPDRLQEFPHSTPLVSGVLVRRGRIVPVLDVAPVLVSPHPPARRFYLIASRRFGSATEFTAIPVTGECLLTSATPLPPTAGLPGYVTGLLGLEGELAQIIDLDRLAAEEARA